MVADRRHRAAERPALQHHRLLRRCRQHLLLTADGITNPIVPLAKGCTAKNALTGASGAWTPSGGLPALKTSCFTLPLLPPGGLNGAIPTSDPYETGFTNGQRNIFRQAFQKRADASLVKVLPLRERYN